MKTQILSFALLFMLIFQIDANAQIRTVKVKNAKTKNVKVNSSTKKAPVRIKTNKAINNASVQISQSDGRKCLPIDYRRLERIVTDKLARSLSIYLDKDKSRIALLGKKSNLSIGNYKVKKPGNDWNYHLKDIRSTRTRVSGKRSSITLQVFFESDGTEIKGKCPGCRVGNDKRAPDFHWKNPNLLIYLKPTAYKGMLTFDVRLVKVMGKLEMNGPTSKFMPSMSYFFKSRIEKAIEKELKQTLNRHEVKTMLGNAFQSEIASLGLDQVLSIDDTKDNIYLCNYRK